MNALKLLPLFFVLLFTACEPKKNADPKAVADNHNEAKFSSPAQEKDALFLSDAAAMCMQQIKLAQLAQQNSIRPDVQEKGKVLEGEYTDIYASIHSLAVAKTVTLPQDVSDAQKKIYKDLGFEISGDFDKKYFAQIAKDHTAIIDEYQKTAAQTNDEELKSFIQKTLPLLNGNLDLINQFKSNITINQKK